jgi:ribosomal RNA assembly protein
MKIIPSEESKKLTKVAKQLEKELNVSIKIKEKEVAVEGDAEDEYISGQVIEAVLFGFPIEAALLIKAEEFLFEILNIKDYTHRKDLERIRARVIGSEGRTLRTLNQLTDCYFEIKGNEVGIIGAPESIKTAHDALIMVVQGSKQANVYAFLEKHHAAPVFDLGLKEPKKEKKAKKLIKKVKE